MYKGVFSFFKTVIHKREVYYLILFSIISSILQVLIGYLYSPLIDKFDSNQYNKTIYYFIVLLSLYIVDWYVNKKFYYQGEMLNKQEEYSIVQNTIDNFNFFNLQKLAINDAGTYQTFLSSDVKNISSYSTNVFIPIIKGGVTFLGALIIGVRLSPILTFSILLLSFIAVYIPKISEKYIIIRKEKEQQMNEEFQKTFLNIIQERKFIKINKLEQYFLNSFDKKLKQFNDSTLSTAKSSILLIGAGITSGFLFTVSWLSIGLYLILTNKITFGNFVTFIILNESFIWIFFSLPNIINDYLQKKVSKERLDKLRTLEMNEGTLMNDPFESLNLINANYHYPKKSKKILSNLNFSIKKLEKKALIGKSGSGKSTLINVILGYNQLTSGQISLNGTTDAQPESLQHLISYMPQNNIIFRGSIKENIFFDKDVTEETINFVLKISGVDEIIKFDENKLFKIIDPFNEGYLNLSEGEKQRICFARLLAKNAEFLLLDEPTAFLDIWNENKIINYLKSCDKTVVMVTHRVDNIPSTFEKIKLSDGQVTSVD